MIFGHVYEFVRRLEDKGRVENGVNAVLLETSRSLSCLETGHMTEFQMLSPEKRLITGYNAKSMVELP